VCESGMNCMGGWWGIGSLEFVMLPSKERNKRFNNKNGGFAFRFLWFRIQCPSPASPALLLDV